VYDSPRSTAVIWVLAAAVAVFALVRLFGGGGEQAPPVNVEAGGAHAAESGGAHAAESGGARAARAGDSASAGTGAELYVHVAGAVRRPGLLRLPSGTRVATALERAGGPTPRADLTLVNLAAPLQDGQQIVVPVRGSAGSPTAGGGALAGTGGGAAPPGAKVHLSTATAEQLDEIDGIGPTLAERIVEYRDAHGGFRSIDELAEVEGIGEKRLATLRDAVQP
jgi:competence protein ComEA